MAVLSINGIDRVFDLVERAVVALETIAENSNHVADHIVVVANNLDEIGDVARYIEEDLARNERKT